MRAPGTCCLQGPHPAPQPPHSLLSPFQGSLLLPAFAPAWNPYSCLSLPELPVLSQGQLRLWLSPLGSHPATENALAPTAARSHLTSLHQLLLA